jgi:hypothetical protein
MDLLAEDLLGRSFAIPDLKRPFSPLLETAIWSLMQLSF